ncbi:MAG: class I SAM-dependent methyltransferase [Rhodospirillales bacterium]|nr:class I SAM-dependent methyltransferase [Rhodospirillales bacterium]
MFPVGSVLRRIVVSGTLEVIDAGGAVHSYGDGRQPKVTMRFHDRLMPWKLLFAPSIALGEGYTEGRLTIENGSTIYDLLALFAENIKRTGNHKFHDLAQALDKMFRHFQQFNPASRAKRNIAHHYDLSGDLYKMFLDRDRQYSCAYFPSPDTDLDTAQENKKSHIAAKLLLKKGQRVLDIGSGWGGMGLYFARHFGAQVSGVTLSEEQHQVSNERAAQEGLADQVKFHLRDYRSLDGEFDRIVSVGMFEHVGILHYQAFFSKMSNILKKDGVALLHTIGRSGPPSSTDPWIRKYIFPGGYIPSLSEVMPPIEKAGLVVTDIEFLGPHYAETVRAWRKRFQAVRSQVAELYDERFCRMWEFYLAGSEVAFRYMNLTVFQIQLTHDCSAVPVTRDYIAKSEFSVQKSDTRTIHAA